MLHYTIIFIGLQYTIIFIFYILLYAISVTIEYHNPQLIMVYSGPRTIVYHHLLDLTRVSMKLSSIMVYVYMVGYIMVSEFDDILTFWNLNLLSYTKVY